MANTVTIEVTAPVAGYEGTVAGAVFVGGKARVPRHDLAALAYFRGGGYTIGARPAAANEEPEPPDPRDVTEAKAGTPLRDAAVDPEPEDFLAPANAGASNPHGPRVVSPGIHGAEPPPPVPGPVSDDPAAQQEKEMAAAVGALAETPPETPEPADDPQPPARARRKRTA